MEPKDPTPPLIRKAQEGDREAFETLVGEYRPAVERFVQKRLGAHLKRQAEAEDVLQETFLKGFQSIRRFRWENEHSFRRWLSAIAEHVILKLATRGERQQKLFLELEVPHDDDPSPSRALRRDERFERLRAALDGLSPDHRQVILLSRIEGLRIKEIAVKMDRSPNAVLLLLSRALKKLRDSFGDTESFHLPLKKLEGRGSANGQR